MSTSPSKSDPRQIIPRIDAAIRELEALRRELTTPAPSHNLTERLFGSLGRGAWDEYDLDLDWTRITAQ